MKMTFCIYRSKSSPRAIHVVFSANGYDTSIIEYSLKAAWKRAVALVREYSRRPPGGHGPDGGWNWDYIIENRSGEIGKVIRHGTIEVSAGGSSLRVIRRNSNAVLHAAIDNRSGAYQIVAYQGDYRPHTYRFNTRKEMFQFLRGSRSSYFTMVYWVGFADRRYRSHKLLLVPGNRFRRPGKWENKGGRDRIAA